MCYKAYVENSGFIKISAIDNEYKFSLVIDQVRKKHCTNFVEKFLTGHCDNKCKVAGGILSTEC